MIIKLFICLILLIILTIFVVNKTFIKDNYKNIQIPRFSYFINVSNLFPFIFLYMRIFLFGSA